MHCHHRAPRCPGPPRLHWLLDEAYASQLVALRDQGNAGFPTRPFPSQRFHQAPSQPESPPLCRRCWKSAAFRALLLRRLRLTRPLDTASCRCPAPGCFWRPPCCLPMVWPFAAGGGRPSTSRCSAAMVAALKSSKTGCRCGDLPSWLWTAQHWCRSSIPPHTRGAPHFPRAPCRLVVLAIELPGWRSEEFVRSVRTRRRLAHASQLARGHRRGQRPVLVRHAVLRSRPRLCNHRARRTSTDMSPISSPRTSTGARSIVVSLANRGTWHHTCCCCCYSSCCCCCCCCCRRSCRFYAPLSIIGGMRSHYRLHVMSSVPWLHTVAHGMASQGCQPAPSEACWGLQGQHSGEVGNSTRTAPRTRQRLCQPNTCSRALEVRKSEKIAAIVRNRIFCEHYDIDCKQLQRGLLPGCASKLSCRTTCASWRRRSCNNHQLQY